MLSVVVKLEGEGGGGLWSRDRGNAIGSREPECASAPEHLPRISYQSLKRLTRYPSAYREAQGVAGVGGVEV